MNSRGKKAAWTACALVCLAGCKDPSPKPVVAARASGVEEPESFRDRVVETMPLSDSLQVVVISFDDFVRISEPLVPSAPVRAEAARIAAKTLHPSALGVFGVLEDGRFEADVFIVAKDLRPSGDEFESSDFVVVSMRAKGEGQHITAPLLGLTAKIGQPDCDPLRRGCHPIFGDDSNSGSPHTFASPDEGGSGLPLTTIVNSEAFLEAANATAYSPELWIIHENDLRQSPNRFLCYGEVDSPGLCPTEATTQSAVVGKAPSFRSLDESFTLISEAEFKGLVENGNVGELSKSCRPLLLPLQRLRTLQRRSDWSLPPKALRFAG